jgi:MFS family permease
VTLLEVPTEVGGPASDGAPPARRAGTARWRRLIPDFRRPETIVNLVVVVACIAFTFWQMQPADMFANTTPTGGDMGAHVWLPWYVGHQLLPHFQITGWTMDWYAGFPVLTFYFPLPILMIVAAHVVLPYNIAFKVVTALGVLALPAAAWVFGRLARLPFPGPACLAAATLPYLFARDWTIYGGNIASTMAGEFCFSISLAFALVFLGVVARGLDNGRHRLLASLLLLATGLSHVLPTIFAVVGVIVLTLMTRSPRSWRWTAPVLVVSALLSAWWSLPFELRLPYATNMGYQKTTNYIATLFPAGLTWLFALALLGAVLSIARRRRIGVFLTVMTVLSALALRYTPQYRLWNARVVPFWYLGLYLLAGLAFYEVGNLIVEAVTAERSRGRRRTLLATPVLTLVVALIWVGYPLRVLPFGHTLSNGNYDWLGISSSDQSYVPDWVKWNYSGYQSPDKPRRAEYFTLMRAMGQIGRQYGCGRAMWEYEPELNNMGTPDALMLLPYWTKGCIGSMEGLYYESSATTPYHFINASELSLSPSNPDRQVNSSYAASPNVPLGVQHLQMFGVRYYMAISPQTQGQANADPSLRLIRRVGPFSVTYTTGNTASQKTRYWNIYRVLDSHLVTPLANQPVVMKGVASGDQAWLAASVAWYDDPGRWTVYEAASGPASWARVSASDPNPPQAPLPPVAVSAVHVHEESMSFDVDRTGVPVLVNTSYYPNWHANGARGPYRVTPNLMVVIPTSRHVSLYYGTTPLNVTADVLTLLGVVGLAGLWWFGPADLEGRRRRQRVAVAGPPAADGLAEPWARLGHELADSAGGGAWVVHDLDGWLDHPGGLEPPPGDGGGRGEATPPVG